MLAPQEPEIQKKMERAIKYMFKIIKEIKWEILPNNKKIL